jgi:transcriptional regulator with XRE-family HTH domain
MEKKQHNSVFQIFILKNKLKKTEIAQYLGVSNAFITQLAQGLRSVPNEKIALIKANKQWDTSMFMDEGEMLTTDPIPQSESKPKQLEFDFNRWMENEEKKTASLQKLITTNSQLSSTNRELVEMLKEAMSKSGKGEFQNQIDELSRRIDRFLESWSQKRAEDAI